MKRLCIGVALLASAYTFAGRRWQLHWGATREEVNKALPGDQLLSVADMTTTRAITIHADSTRVWPWIAQIGQGRGGFYSYDALENLVGCDIHSADRIVPEWQDVKIGDEVRLAPKVPLEVTAVEAGRALALRGGVPMGNAPPPYDFTWAFVIDEQSNRASRLLVRERYTYTRRWSSLLVEPVEVVSFLMTQRMLRGIRDRAERFSRTSVAG
jgi:hypothetical protein